VLVLVLATLAAAGYLYLTRGGNTAGATGFVGADQQSVKAIDTVVTAADGVQRFAGLHPFDVTATAQIQVLSRQLTALQHIAAGASGRQKQIADDAVTTVRQAIDAAAQYRKAVAFTYRLADADSAHQDLNNAVASLKQQARDWQHS
jgi:hypothetical protein